MRRKYKKLSLWEREQLAVYRARGKTLREIARLLRRSHSTLSRELRRFGTTGDVKYYFPCEYNEIAEVNKRYAGRRKKISNDLRLSQYIEEKLKSGWSPEIISGRIRIDQPDCVVSHETIYQYVYDNALRLAGYLPRRRIMRMPKRYYRKRRECKIPNRLSIDKRPSIINNRKQFGHWESDLMVNSGRGTSVHVLVERKSRYVKINRIEDKTADSVSKSLIQAFINYPSYMRRSITYDNGSENVRHEEINAVLKTISFFCNAYHSWEKGSVENMNGLIRRYIPKKMDLSLVGREDIRHIEYQLNNRPKKCLNYQTPQEVFNRYLCLVQ